MSKTLTKGTGNTGTDKTQKLSVFFYTVFNIKYSMSNLEINISYVKFLNVCY